MKWPEVFLYTLMISAWVCGIAIAKGFWLTLGAVLLPPMAWVLLAMKLLP